MHVRKKIVNGAQHAIGLGLVLSFTGCATSSNEQALLLEEVKGIRLTLDGIAAKLSEKEIKQQKALSFSGNYGRSPERGVDFTKLSSIRLPDAASDADIIQYIKEIKKASKGQNRFSNNDPQVTLYMEVGVENIHLLIEALPRGQNGSMDSYYIIPAIERLVERAQKPLIMDSLLRHPPLVKVVSAKAWEEDARAILLSEIKSRKDLSIDWIKATAALNAPESYPYLRDYFIENRNPSAAYRYIKDLPIEDLLGAVGEAWAASQSTNQYEQQRMAQIAVKYGYLDAFEFLAQELVDMSEPGSSSSSYTRNEMRSTLLSVTRFRGDSAALVDWIKENKASLEFDTEAKKFVVKDL